MGALIKFLWHLVLALQPSDSQDVKVQMIWRRTIAFTTSALVVLWAGSLAWAQGWIPYIPGVATTQDVSQVSDKLGAAMASLANRQKFEELVTLRSSLKQDLKEICLAVGARNQTALDRANGDFDSDNSRYRNLAGTDYERAPCSVILIQPGGS